MTLWWQYYKTWWHFNDTLKYSYECNNTKKQCIDDKNDKNDRNNRILFLEIEIIEEWNFYNIEIINKKISVISSFSSFFNPFICIYIWHLFLKCHL